MTEIEGGGEKSGAVPVRPQRSASLALAEFQTCSRVSSSAIQWSGEETMLVSHFVGLGGAAGVSAGGPSHEGGSRVRWTRYLSSTIAEGLVYSPGNSRTAT